MDMMREFRVPNELLASTRTLLAQHQLSGPGLNKRSAAKQDTLVEAVLHLQDERLTPCRRRSMERPPGGGKRGFVHEAALLQASCSIQQMDGVKAVSEFGVKTTSSKSFRQSTTGWSEDASLTFKIPTIPNKNASNRDEPRFVPI